MCILLGYLWLLNVSDSVRVSEGGVSQIATSAHVSEPCV